MFRIIFHRWDGTDIVWADDVTWTDLPQAIKRAALITVGGESLTIEVLS